MFLSSFLVQFSSVSQACPTLCNPMDCSTPGFPVHHQLPGLLKLMSIKSLMPFRHLIVCQPLLLPSIFPGIRVFYSESVLRIRWPKQWSFSFSFSINPSNEYSGLNSFRMDWLDLLEVQGTLKSSPTPQFKTIISSALSFLNSPTLTSIHDYWKNHRPDQTLLASIFVGKVKSLLFNMLSRLGIAFLPRTKHLLISWLQSSSAVILEAKKVKSLIVSMFPHLLLVMKLNQ